MHSKVESRTLMTKYRPLKLVQKKRPNSAKFPSPKSLLILRQTTKKKLKVKQPKLNNWEEVLLLKIWSLQQLWLNENLLWKLGLQEELPNLMMTIQDFLTLKWMRWKPWLRVVVEVEKQHQVKVRKTVSMSNNLLQTLKISTVWMSGKNSMNQRSTCCKQKLIHSKTPFTRLNSRIRIRLARLMLPYRISRLIWAKKWALNSSSQCFRPCKMTYEGLMGFLKELLSKILLMRRPREKKVGQ